MTNNGDADLYGVEVSDEMFDGTTVSGIQWPIIIDELTQGAVKTFSATYTVPNNAAIGSTIANTVNVEGWTYQENLATDSAIAEFTVRSPGGGGGSPGGGGGSTPGTDDNIILDDEEIPAGPILDEEIIEDEVIELIDEESIPAGPTALPKTGGIPALALYGIGALLAVAGAGMKLRSRK